MKKTILLTAITGLFALNSCSDDDGKDLIDFTVSFNAATISTTEGDTAKEVTLTFSRAATKDGTINLEYTTDNAVYGTDFTTDPDGSSGTLTIPVASGDMNTSFTFNKLTNAIEGTTKSVTFSLSGYSDPDWSNGSTSTTLVSYTPIAATTGVIDTETGGSNQPNQVYFDFSTGIQTAVKRDSWEIALYNGEENRVFLNSSLLVTAATLPGMTDLLAVTEATALGEPMELQRFSIMDFTAHPVTVNTVGELAAGLPIDYGMYGNLAEGINFTDTPEGTLAGTAMAEVSTVPEENFVHLISLGSEIPTDPAELGSINTTGSARKIIKVRVFSDGNSYTVQYADLNETTTLSEITVPKNTDLNLSAVSLTSGGVVDVEPAKDQWDINLSGVFSYYGAQGGMLAGLTFSDYVLHNTLAGVGAYQVTIAEGIPTYANFTREDVDETAFDFENRALIGSGWRTTFGTPQVNDDRYYIIKDADGNYYKMNFTAFTSTEGERGHFQFTYDRL